MRIKMMCNWFLHDSRQLVYKHIEKIADEIWDGFAVDDVQMKLSVSSLAANIALHSLNTGEDAEIQILCSCMEFIKVEKDEKVIHLLALGIFRFVGKSNPAKKIAKEVNFNGMSLMNLTRNQMTRNCLKSIDKLVFGK